MSKEKDLSIEEILVEIAKGGQEKILEREHGFEPQRINVFKVYKKEFYPLGIINLFIMFFDEAHGPVLHSYAREDKMIKEIKENPVFGAEVTILAKYAHEVLLKEGRRLIIRDVNIANKQYYLFVLVDKGFISPKPLKIAKVLAEEIEKSNKIDEPTIINGIETALRTLGRYMKE